MESPSANTDDTPITNTTREPNAPAEAPADMANEVMMPSTPPKMEARNNDMFLQ
jgi:hypothetical protein